MKPALNEYPEQSDAEKRAWLKLARTENVGPITFYRLLQAYGSASNALDALPEMAARGGRKKPLNPPKDQEIDKELNGLEKIGGRVLTFACDDYPNLLRCIDDAPPVISVIGNTGLLNQSCIAIVGARNASHNGKKFTEKLARELGEREHIITSGLARGIDTAAHIGSLDSGTIAVVAGGIDVVYPEENQKLYEAICERGVVVAESALGQKPFAQSFPRRNRIVSGMSRGAVVVEANMRSGSLITARLASEQGREVYAVPGHPMDPRADGPNHLIREGATLVRNANDILEGLMNFDGNGFREIISNQNTFEQPLEIDENTSENAYNNILSALSFQAVNVDELIRACQLSVSTVQTVLLELELAGRVKRLPGNKVSLIEEG